MREPSAKTLTSRLLASTALASALALTAPAAAQQVLPTGGSVASGAATISTSGSAMTIQQTTPRAVVNWNSFSVGAPNSVTFAQPDAGSATLNRVTGSTPSSIAGEINANGQVYLVNPNGIAITRGGTVNVGGGFVASTLGVSDADFNNGKLKFTGSGASAAVSNDGTITTGPGGVVGLIGGSVANSGTITAPLGKVALGSGEQATLDLTGDGFLQVALPTNATTADGKALVDVSGTVKAAGGRIAIKAATAASAVRNAINLSGVASARSARKVGGSIVLGGGDGGDVNVSGALDASGRKGGGSVAVIGHKVALRNAALSARSSGGSGGAVAVSGTGAVKLVRARLDVSGATGGGTISVGGSPRGLGPLVNSASTTVSTSVLRADALTSGDGGAITVWSSGATSVTGALTARGGALSGHGGTVETSGETAHLTGAHVDTTAAQGATGSWLIDPTDFTIAASGGDITGAALSGELATTNITILSSQGTHGGTNGDVNVNDAVTWSSGNTLTLSAFNNININAPITITGAGGLVLTYGTGSGGEGGDYVFNTVGPSGTGEVLFTGAGGSLTIGGAPYTLVRTLADLQGMTGFGHWALANNVSLNTSVNNDVVATFEGTFAGLNNTISGLSITGTGAGPVGFFANAFGLTRDLILTGGVVNGGAANTVGAIAGSILEGEVSGVTSYDTVTGTGTQIGGLVGLNQGVLLNSRAYGTVTGASSVGGLVGENDGPLTQGAAFGTVTGGNNTGGLVGLNSGTISGSYATGAVSAAGGTGVGGLVGENNSFASIADSYATGATLGGTDVGGLVGASLGSATISDVYSTGTVTGTAAVGGLIGSNAGTVSGAAYWDEQTSGQLTSAAGTPEFTATLQGGAALPTPFTTPTFAGGSAGGETNVYPYLTSFFPNGVRAVSGIAYKDNSGFTPLVSSAAGAATVYVDTAGSIKNAVTTGANGYYYYFVDLAKLPTGSDLVAYTVANVATGATNAATYLVTAGANNTVANVFGSTLTETTAALTYSQVVTGVAAATQGDAAATSAIAGVSFIAINATGASFTVDQAISTTAVLTVNATAATVDSSVVAGSVTFSGPVTLANNVQGATLVDFQGPVTLGASVTVTSPFTIFAQTIDGSATPNAGLTVTGGTVNLYGNVTTNNGALSFDGPVILDANVVMNSGTATTAFASTVDSFGDTYSSGYGLTATAGAFSFGGAIGGTYSLGAVSLVSTAAITLPSITANTIFAQTTGAGASVTIGATDTLTALASTGTAVTLVAAGAFINDSGPNAIVFPNDPPNWLIYSNNPTADFFNGLNSNDNAIWNTTYPDSTAPTTGNYYLFAYQPTVTFTSINDSKTYGADATAKVATDYTVTGINPGVPNAYLPDTPAIAYSGTPSVTSAGSPGSATVAGGPYTIAVAPGSVAALNGYAAAFVSSGKLTVNPEAITVSATTNTKTYDSTTSAAATPTVTSGALYDAATLSETYATPNVGTGLTLTPKIAFASPAAASNYTVTLAPAAIGTINPEAITITAAANSKVYDTTTAAAATPTVTTGTLYDAATLSETYATPNAGTGLTLTPKIAFASATAAGNYTVTLTPAAVGTITPEPITVTATTNTKVYDTTTAAAATPTVTTGTLYDAATLSETYATPNAGTGLTLTPKITFASAAAAGNYTVTLTPAAVGTINPEAITVTATTNTKVYDSTTTAAATPTVTTGTLYDGATLSETYATPNAGTGLTLNPTIAFASPSAASNYAVTLAPVFTGVITPEPITVTATTNSKVYNATTAAAATPTVTAGALYDAATLSETYATPNVGSGLTLTPQIAFASPAAASNYAVTLAPAQIGTITPEPITVTLAPNTKVYDATIAAAATPTVTAGTLYDAATLSETYAAPNAGTGLTLYAQVTFANPAAGGNYAFTLAGQQVGTITPEPITVTATPNTKIFDGNTSAAALPVLTAGTLFDPATLSETYATPGPGDAISLIPAVAFNNTATAGNYAVTLVPTGTSPTYTGVILPPETTQINLSPSVFVNRNPLIGIPGDASTCGPDVQLPDPSSFADPVAAVQAISAATSQYVERCRDASQEDIANALERYADALQVIIEKLPPKLRVQLQHIPAMVRAAAVRARAAPTRAAAVRVLRQTVAAVHHEITLVRAEDPDSARIRNAVNTGVSGVLNSAAVALARSEGI